jgi:GntR family transcriptional regulator
MQTWNDRQPIYQQLADILAAQLLDGDPPEGEAMPSVRGLAGRYLLNPLTVNRALQALGEEGLLENRRGMRLRRLGIAADQLIWEERA